MSAQKLHRCALCRKRFLAYPYQRRKFCSDACTRTAHAAHPIAPRFWSKVLKRSANKCWTWNAYRAKNGYGNFGIGRTVYLAHRVAYCIANRVAIEDISDWCVMHSCDNRGCVNPRHLSLGTYADNNRDMHAKGRGTHTGARNPQRGEQRYNARFTEKQVLRVRKLYASGYTCAELTRMFGASGGWVHNVVNRRLWKHI